MDGTILDTLEDLWLSTNYVMRALDMPEHTLEDVRRAVGNGIRAEIERMVFPGSSPETIERAYRLFLQYYAQHCDDNTHPYDGIRELIAELRISGIKVAVVSNKGDEAVQILGKRYFPDGFDFAVGQREGIRLKPAPDSIEEVLRTLRVDRKNAVYIGDSQVDVQTAANARMDGIAVTWGFRARSELLAAGAGVIVDTMDELKAALMG